ncbi:hypothetical protein HDU76_007318, partial [Blyttiomyces sp. JEL0837]
MSTLMPFQGGSAMFSRVALGSYIGYVVGQCELWVYALIVAYNIFAMGQGLSEVFGTESRFEPLYWILQLT